MVGNRGFKLFCVLGTAVTMLASCGSGTTGSESLSADSQDEFANSLTTVEIGTPATAELNAPSDADAGDKKTTEKPANAAGDPDAVDTGAVEPDVVEPEAAGTRTREAVPEAGENAAESAGTMPGPQAAAPLTKAPVSSAGSSSIERRIADLTNELRTNPNGPLRRTGEVPNCDNTIQFDPATGQPVSVAALKFDDKVSLQMARPWSVQMKPNNFKHRDNQLDVLRGIGISPSTAGENIAYHSPTKSDPAMFHFTQWRQSDGHFCNMMSSAYTSIGVGEHQHGGGSFATQNFYG